MIQVIGSISMGIFAAGMFLFAVSLGAPAVMRFRRGRTGAWEVRRVLLAPGSAYVLSGPVRAAWQHSIPPVDALRYSVTFRTVRSRAAS